MENVYRTRRITGFILFLALSFATIILHPALYQPVVLPLTDEQSADGSGEALTVLNQLAVKGRAPKTDYSRAQFGQGWSIVNGCDTRNIILHRDMTQVVMNEGCQVVSGTLADPYTGATIIFTRGATTSQAVQIDHVVALSNAWQTGAQQLTSSKREALANDPLELLAVDGPANQEKSDGDAATWLPSNKSFRCQYIARQIAVKARYNLWVTAPERKAMQTILETCPAVLLPDAGIVNEEKTVLAN